MQALTTLSSLTKQAQARAADSLEKKGDKLPILKRIHQLAITVFFLVMASFSSDASSAWREAWAQVQTGWVYTKLDARTLVHESSDEDKARPPIQADAPAALTPSLKGGRLAVTVEGTTSTPSYRALTRTASTPSYRALTRTASTPSHRAGKSASALTRTPSTLGNRRQSSASALTRTLSTPSSSRTQAVFSPSNSSVLPGRPFLFIGYQGDFKEALQQACMNEWIKKSENIFRIFSINLETKKCSPLFSLTVVDEAAAQTESYSLSELEGSSLESLTMKIRGVSESTFLAISYVNNTSSRPLTNPLPSSTLKEACFNVCSLLRPEFRYFLRVIEYLGAKAALEKDLSLRIRSYLCTENFKACAVVINKKLVASAAATTVTITVNQLLIEVFPKQAAI